MEELYEYHNKTNQCDLYLIDSDENITIHQKTVKCSYILEKL